MVTQKKAIKLLIAETKKRKFKFTDWLGKQFEVLKFATPTEKGDIGEDFLVELLRGCGYNDVTILEGRRGDYDISAVIDGKEVKFEVKVATQDTNGNFQFGGIRYDTQYTHLFCLGIRPDTIDFLIIQKQDLGRPPHKLAPMASSTNSSFKLTKKPDDLISFDKFQDEIVKQVK